MSKLAFLLLLEHSSSPTGNHLKTAGIQRYEEKRGLASHCLAAAWTLRRSLV